MCHTRLAKKTVGDCTAKSRLDVTETQFAIDAVLYSTSQVSFETSSKGFVSEAADWVLTVSKSKTKGMVVGQSLNVSDMGQ